MPATPIYVVDAFAEGPFSGNPAGVCPLDGPADAAWMRRVAAEMNHSETAFTHPTGDGFALRWFTPTVEVDLCGHATLAAAHALWETGRLSPDAAARFHTRSGVLTPTRRPDGGIELDFPAKPVDAAEPPRGLLDALGLAGARPTFVGRNRMDWLVALADEAAVRTLAPDFRRLAAVQARGAIVTAPSADPAAYDFASRFFGPAVGVDEDPVTGSAHCALGPFWAERLGRASLRARQLSRRGGALDVTVAGDRVRLGGRAVTTLRGELLV